MALNALEDSFLPQSKKGGNKRVEEPRYYGLSARVPVCQKIKKGRLDQYGPEHFGRLIFATVRKKWE